MTERSNRPERMERLSLTFPPKLDINPFSPPKSQPIGFTGFSVKMISFDKDSSRFWVLIVSFQRLSRIYLGVFGG